MPACLNWLPLIAAQHGMAAIPEDWKARTTGYAEAEALADKLVALRGA